MKALLALVLLAASAPARADEASTSDDVAFEAKGFYKAYAAWLRLPPLPSLPQYAMLSTHTARLDGGVRIGLVDFDVAYQAAAIGASDARLVAVGGGLLGGSARAPARRWIDLEPVLLEDDAFAVVQNLDRFALSLHAPFASVVVGRQAISWGTGYLWNPTDLFSPFSPLDVDREVRRGADAARVSVPLGDTAELDLLWLPQPRIPDQGAVVRARANFFGFDFSTTAAKYVDDLVAGADFAGDVGPLGVHGEAAVTLPIPGLLDDDPATGATLAAAFVRAVGGVSARPLEPWTIVAEYHFNGFGTDDPNRYLQKLTSDRVARGEVFGAGRHYVGVVNALMVNELTTFSVTAIVNAQDPSGVGVVSLEHSLTQNVLVRGGASVPFGEGEFDLTPLSLFVQLGAYFG